MKPEVTVCLRIAIAVFLVVIWAVLKLTIKTENYPEFILFCPFLLWSRSTWTKPFEFRSLKIAGVLYMIAFLVVIALIFWGLSQIDRERAQVHSHSAWLVVPIAILYIVGIVHLGSRLIAETFERQEGENRDGESPGRARRLAEELAARNIAAQRQITRSQNGVSDHPT